MVCRDAYTRAINYWAGSPDFKSGTKRPLPKCWNGCYDQCGNFDDFLSFEDKDKNDPDYQPDLYYYWDSPLEEDYDWRDNFPLVDCFCEICFDIANSEGKIKWKEDS